MVGNTCTRMRLVLVMMDVIGKTELGTVFGGRRIPNIGIAIRDQFESLESFQCGGKVSHYIGVTPIGI